MKILVVCVSSATTPDGVTRHATSLAGCLLHHPEVEEVHLVVGTWQVKVIQSLLCVPSPHLRVTTAESAPSAKARNLWYLTALPRLARQLGVDLVHLAYPAPMQRSRFSCPVVTTLHDLYPIDAPYNFGFPRVFLNRAILWQCLSAVDAVACVSNSTLTRLKSHNPQYATKASYIPNCVGARTDASGSPDPRLEHQPFLLAIAQHRRNKNLALTLKAFHQVSLQHPELLLVIVGNKGPETASLNKLLEQRHISSRVVLLHGIPDHQLQWCYEHCRLLLATSSVEGFGLPIVEAMLSACPVVCSDIPAFREFGSAYCRFVPLDADAAPAFANAVQQLMTQPRPAPHHLTPLRDAAVADQCLRLYRSLLTDRSHSLKPLTLQPRKDDAL